MIKLCIVVLAVAVFLLASFAPAEVGNSLAFSSTTMLVSNNFLNATPGFTIAFWFNRTGGWIPCLMGYPGWYLQFYPDANSFDVFVGGDRTATFAYTNGGWYHCAVVQNTNSLKIYRNGIQVYSSAYGGAPANGTFIIGRYPSGGYNYGGRLDDLAWWNRMLSSGEVYTVAGGGTPSYADTNSAPWNSGLVGLWRFDESTGTNAADVTANNNFGRITGGVWTNGIVPLATPAPASATDNKALLVLDALLSEANR